MCSEPRFGIPGDATTGLMDRAFRNMHCLYVQMSQLEDLSATETGAIEELLKEVHPSLTGDLLQSWQRKHPAKEEELKRFVSATASQDFKLARHPEEHLKIRLSEADLKVVADFAHRMDLDEMHAFDIWLLMVKNYIDVFHEGDGVCASFVPSYLLPAGGGHDLPSSGGAAAPTAALVVEDHTTSMMSYLYLEQVKN